MIQTRNLIWNPPGTDWNTTGTNKNWLDGVTAVAFAGSNDTVNFTDAGLTVSGSVVVDAGGVTPAAVNVSNSGGVYTISGGAIGGSAAFTKTNGGEVVLAGSNTYTGNTIISAGTVTVSTNSNLGADTADVVLSGGALKVTGDVSLAAGRDLSGSGGTLDVPTGNTLTVSGAVNMSGPLTLSNAGTVALAGTSNAFAGLNYTDAGSLTAGANTVTVNGDVTASQSSGNATLAGTVAFGSSSRNVTVTNAGASLTTTGKITATGRLTKLGDGVLVLNGDNSGMTTGFRLGGTGASPAAGGTMRISTRNALGASAATLQFNNGTLEATADLTGASAIPGNLSIGAPDTVNGGAGAVFAGSNVEFAGSTGVFKTAGVSQYKVTVHNTLTLSGALAASSGAATTPGFTVAGPGKLVIGNASNGWDLPITVDGATVAVNGAMTSAAASFTLVNGGTLKGSGPIAGAVDSGDGTIAPGSSVGNLTTGGQTWASGGTYAWEIDSAAGTPGTDWDHISMTSLAVTATSGNKFTIKLIAPVTPAGFNPASHYTWKIGTATGPVSGFGSMVLAIDRSSFSGADPQGKFSMIQIGGDISVHYVPEPATAAGAGLLALLALRRR